MRSGTQSAIELCFGVPPLPEKAWRARAFPPGLASHKRRRSVQKLISGFEGGGDVRYAHVQREPWTSQHWPLRMGPYTTGNPLFRERPGLQGRLQRS